MPPRDFRSSDARRRSKTPAAGRSSDGPLPDWTPPELATLRRNLIRWSGKLFRELPWRAVGDPYRVWISEIMLQQTTVAAVIPYYERFLRRFPDVAALAAASEQDVLALWEGLGYYSRGRNLHRAARVVIETHGGRFPETPEELQALPGVGRYTAGAIASFAFDRRAAIVEANTLRLYCRLLGDEGDPRSVDGQRRLWRFAEAILPTRGIGRFNQALMDLGATICTPTNPDCAKCPLKSVCRAFRSGRQALIPRPKPAAAVTHVDEVAFAIRRRGRYLVRQRTPAERWAGLWDFPRIELPAPPGEAMHTSWLRQLGRETGITASTPQALASADYTVTRFRIHLHRLVAEYAAGKWKPDAPSRWVAAAAMAELPMSRPARDLARELAQL